MTYVSLHVLLVMQTLILGDRMARVKSVTLMLSRWHTFCAAGGDTWESQWKMVDYDEIGKHAEEMMRRVYVCVRTSVVRHGGLVRVTLLLEGHVSQLQHSRHHLQQT